MKAERLGVCWVRRKRECPRLDENSPYVVISTKINNVSRAEKDARCALVRSTQTVRTASTAQALGKGTATPGLMPTVESIRRDFFMSRSLQYPDGCLSVCSLIIQSCNVLIILHFFSNLCTKIGCSIIVIYDCPNWFDMVYLHLQHHCV